MAREHVCGVESTAAIARHPLHPIIVIFPAAFLIGAFVCDLVFASNGDSFWAMASYRLLVAGLVTGLLAAAFGLIEFLTIAQARRTAGWVHFIGNAAVLVLAIINISVRSSAGGPEAAGSGLTLSLLTTVILLVTAWFGGELAYRHRIGMMRPTAREAVEERTTVRAA